MSLSKVEMGNTAEMREDARTDESVGFRKSGFTFQGDSARPGSELRRAAGREMGGCGGVLSEGSQIAAAEQFVMLDFGHGGSV